MRWLQNGAAERSQPIPRGLGSAGLRMTQDDPQAAAINVRKLRSSTTHNWPASFLGKCNSTEIFPYTNSTKKKATILSKDDVALRDGSEGSEQTLRVPRPPDKVRSKENRICTYKNIL